MAELRASIVITTKNRKDDLRTALLSAVRQAGDPEVIVVDDGSDDGTAAMVRAEFPTVVLHSFPESKGYIVRRNFGASAATGDIVVSVDDDAEFSTGQTLVQMLRSFADPRVGAVAMPFVNVKYGPEVHQRDAEGRPRQVERYIGTAHALRRDLFLRLGGYREVLFHQGEESDYCLRMLDAGFIVVLGDSDPILHYESPRRDFRRMDVYGRRNDVLLGWQNAPWAHLPGHQVRMLARAVVFGLRVRRFPAMLEGWCKGWGAVLAGRAERRPVSRDAWRLFMRMRYGR